MNLIVPDVAIIGPTWEMEKYFIIFFSVHVYWIKITLFETYHTALFYRKPSL